MGGGYLQVDSPNYYGIKSIHGKLFSAAKAKVHVLMNTCTDAGITRIKFPLELVSQVCHDGLVSETSPNAMKVLGSCPILYS